MTASKSEVPTIEIGIEKGPPAEPFDDYLQFYGLNVAAAPVRKVNPPPVALQPVLASKVNIISNTPEKVRIEPQVRAVEGSAAEKPKPINKYRVSMQRCVVCNGLDFRHIEVCVNCGFEKRSLLAKGKFIVFLEKKADLKLAQDFFRSQFPHAEITQRVYRKRQMLVSHVSKSMVQLLLARTANAGFSLEVKEVDPNEAQKVKIVKFALSLACVVVLVFSAMKNFFLMAVPVLAFLVFFYWDRLKKQAAQPILGNLAAHFKVPRFALKTANLSSIFNSQKMTRPVKEDLCQMITQYFHLHEYIRKDKPYYARHLEKMIEKFSGLSIRIQYIDSQIRKCPEKEPSLVAVVEECQQKQDRIRSIFSDMVTRSMKTQPILGPEDLRNINALDL